MSVSARHYSRRYMIRYLKKQCILDQLHTEKRKVNINERRWNGDRIALNGD